MIIKDKREKYDGTWRIVYFVPDNDGKLVPQIKKTELDDQIDGYYVQRTEKMKRLYSGLVAGDFSPIRFFVEYNNMTVKDIAARMKISSSKVKKHMTLDGFPQVKIEALQKYAKIFDIGVADFFQFTFIPDNVSVQVKKFKKRLLQQVDIEFVSKG